MHFFIEKLKICNFLSFLGEYEINLKPFSAIMCNYYQGKEDFLKSLEFVFGGRLNDLKIENPLDLVHKILREEFLVKQELQCFAEVTLMILPEKKQLKFRKSIRNGTNAARIEHKIADIISSKLFYEEKLDSLGLLIKQKNLIFDKSCFNNIIWGSCEDLERTICFCLREPYKAEEWKKAREEIKRLTQLKHQAGEKSYNSVRKSHSVIEKYTDKFEAICFNQESIRKEFLEKFMQDSSEENFPGLDSFKEEDKPSDLKERNLRIFDLEVQIDVLAKKLESLKLKEAVLTAHLYHEEIKLAAKPVNSGILQTRISEVKNKIREQENKLSVIWEEVRQKRLELDNLFEKICNSSTSIYQIQHNIFLQNRFTVYGRFNDYLQPSRYMQLLKQIIGPEIFYAHLCDALETAIYFVNLLKCFKYEHREVFICFENYSHKLKDEITASGEQGIQINTLEQLLIFLCKLKHFNLIDEVPVLVQKDFIYDDSVPEDYIIYTQNGLYFTKDGLISYLNDGNAFCMESEEGLRKNFIQYQREEELQYQELNDLVYSKWETLSQMVTLENDITYLKQKWKKSSHKPLVVPEQPQITEIYEDFTEIFEQYAKEWDECERESLQEDLLSSERRSPLLGLRYTSSSSGDSLDLIQTDLEDVLNEKLRLQKELKSLNKEFYWLCTGPFNEIRIQKKCLSFHQNVDKTKLFFEKEFKKLKKLMTEDDFDDFMGSQEWRKILINSLIKDYDEIKHKLKTSAKDFQTIDAERQKKLTPLIEHLSHHLSSTFSHLVDDALPFIDLNFNAKGEKLQLMSCMGDDRINVVDIKHFNTFLKFASCLTIFLELAIHEKIPVMILDDMEEYFPLHDEDLATVFDFSTLEKIIPNDQNSRFHLFMRIGQFMEQYIKKNTPRNQIRNNGSNDMAHYMSGPVQILYFAKGDMIHAADHYIWIHSQLLPEEYITDDCNSYSEIHELNFENFN